MAKIYPSATIASSSSSSSSKRETFTIWWKSLVGRGNGLTVFNSNGDIVYRIDNYDTKHSNKAYLMDVQGKVLYAIRRKRLQFSSSWNGYSCNDPLMKDQKPWFRVKKIRKLLERDSGFRVIVECNEIEERFYRVENEITKKLAFKIIDDKEEVVAEAKRKESSSGVVLGEDVLSLVVRPHVDHSFVMALVAVHGLIHNKM
ncbi:protein LURP-one-related 4-like [Diospyros lotus]|uniref:protein LURP-one-related 4-like n=1 Tax=Diospyros lotus TaxID=55363 RepID=UPI00224D21BA|nr:protein LURP-one-related 4-like [Diospyros lotus]